MTTTMTTNELISSYELIKKSNPRVFEKCRQKLIKDELNYGSDPVRLKIINL